MASDAGIHANIEELVAEEHELWSREGSGNATEEDRRRLAEIKVSLDQCWDLLRQRKALSEFGRDEDDASVRAPERGRGLRAVSRFTDALNGQVASEFGASQQYIAIAVHYDAESLPQLAAHFYLQAVEERNHAMMIVQYLIDADVEVAIPGVASPQTAFDDDRAPVALALEQEKTVTAQIANLVQIARAGQRIRRRAVPRLVPRRAARRGREHVDAAVGDRPRRRRQPAPRRGLPEPRGRRTRGRAFRTDSARGGRRALGGSVDAVGCGGEPCQLQLDQGAGDFAPSGRRPELIRHSTNYSS